MRLVICKDTGETFTEYPAYLQSNHWKMKREEYISSLPEGYACEDCGDAEKLHIHHLTYENIGDEKLEDLRLLCPVCHSAAHHGGFNFHASAVNIRIYPKFWQSKRVSRLSLEATGVLVTLIMKMCTSELRITERAVSKRLGMSEVDWLRIKAELMEPTPLIYIEDGYILNKEVVKSFRYLKHCTPTNQLHKKGFVPERITSHGGFCPKEFRK